MPSAFVTVLALACLASALAATTWSRLRVAGARRRAEALVRAVAPEAPCATAREVQ